MFLTHLVLQHVHVVVGGLRPLVRYLLEMSQQVGHVHPKLFTVRNGRIRVTAHTSTYSSPWTSHYYNPNVLVPAKFKEHTPYHPVASLNIKLYSHVNFCNIDFTSRAAEGWGGPAPDGCNG